MNEMLSLLFRFLSAAALLFSLAAAERAGSKSASH